MGMLVLMSIIVSYCSVPNHRNFISEKSCRSQLSQCFKNSGAASPNLDMNDAIEMCFANAKVFPLAPAKPAPAPSASPTANH